MEIKKRWTAEELRQMAKDKFEVFVCQDEEETGDLAAGIAEFAADLLDENARQDEALEADPASDKYMLECARAQWKLHAERGDEYQQRAESAERELAELRRERAQMPECVKKLIDGVSVVYTTCSTFHGDLNQLMAAVESYYASRAEAGDKT